MGRPSSNLSTAVSYDTHFFAQRVDHFSFRTSATFQQRYLLNIRSWGGAQKQSPIFVECGGESALEQFVGPSLMWEFRDTFQAMLVVIEHRYYGQSIVTPNQTNQLQDPHELAYLTSEQALGDFATLVLDLKLNFSAQDSPVVTFGGSYAGMLAAWLRLKYPHVTIGSIASSAPILLFHNLVPSDSFNRILSMNYKETSSICFDTIKKSWNALHVEAEQAGGVERLIERFVSCRDTTRPDVGSVIAFFMYIWTSAAQYDYPYPYGVLPANSVKQICKAIGGMPDGTDVITRVFAGARVYWDILGDDHTICHFLAGEEADISTMLWQWQECTEMVFPIASNETNSMFPPTTFDLEQYMAGCNRVYGVAPRPHWIIQEYGGHDIRTVLRHYASNIIFYNGLLDPWSSGGVLEDISQTILAIVAPKGAHVLDILGSNKDDPDWLIELRRQERNHIEEWLLQYYSDWNATHLSIQKHITKY